MGTQRQAKNFVKSWKANNPVMINRRRSRLARLIGWASNSPLRAVILLVVGTSGLSSLVSISGLGRFLHITFSDSFWSVNSIFFAVWDVQATILAVIYPIVIAFVAIMLRRMAVPNAFLEMYIEESAVKFAGASAIGLVAWMALQQIYLPYESAAVTYSWLLSDLVWLLLNLALTANFVHRTLEFVQPRVRRELVRNRALNEWWPNEVFRHMGSNVWLNSATNGVLPHARIFAFESTGPLAVIGSGRAQEGDVTYRFPVPGGRYLVDIRTGLIRIVIRSWIRRAGRNKSNGHIKFPVSPNEYYQDSVTVCIADKRVGITRIEKLVLRKAFVFSRYSRSPSHDVESLFATLKTEALSAFKDGDTDGFQGALSEFEDLYVEIVQSSIFFNEDGEIVNTVQIQSGMTLVAHPLYRKWMREIRAVGDRVIEESGYLNAEYVRPLIYLLPRIAGRLQDVGDSSVAAWIIEYFRTYYLVYRSWWRGRCIGLGRSESRFGHEYFLEGAHATRYRELLRTLVGAWEETKNTLLHLSRVEVQEWKLGRIVTLYRSHMETTVDMLVYAICEGDAEAAWWFEDVLVKWFAGIEHDFSGGETIFGMHERIGLEVIEDEWSVAKKVVEAGFLFEEDVEKQKLGLAREVISRYWRESVLVTACTLLADSRSVADEEDFALRIGVALTQFRGVHPGQERRGQNPRLRRPEELYGWFVEIAHTGSERGGAHETVMDSIVRSIRQAYPDDHVPGRMYSGVGADDFASTIDGQIVAAMTLSAHSWDAKFMVDKCVSDGLVNDDRIRRSWLRDTEQWINRLDDENFEKEWRSKYNGLESEVDEIPDFDRAIANVRNGLSNIKRDLEKRRKSDIVNTPVDPNRLRNLADMFWSGVMTDDGRMPPLCFFDDLAVIGNGEVERGFRLSGYSKGLLTNPLLEQQAVNEDEWLAGVGKDRVASSVMTHIREKWEVKTTDGSSPDRYWQAVSARARELAGKGLKPILLVESASQPYWLARWRRGAGAVTGDRPADMEVWHDEGESRIGYICNLGEVAVFLAPLPFGASFVVAEESFKRTNFGKRVGDRCIEAYVEDPEQEETTVRLVFKWEFTCELRDFEVTRIEYGASGVETNAEGA